MKILVPFEDNDCETVRRLKDECLHLKEEKAQLEYERKVYQTLLEAAGYQCVPDIPKQGIEIAEKIGKWVKKRSLNLIKGLEPAAEEVEKLKGKLDSSSKVTESLNSQVVELKAQLSNAIGVLTLYTRPTDEVAQGFIQSLKDTLARKKGS